MSKQLEKIKELIAKREQARLGGGEKAIEKQHARGKYTARERIDMLLDDMAAGRKFMKVYRQMKMYNDPTLNPVLYGQNGSK